MIHYRGFLAASTLAIVWATASQAQAATNATPDERSSSTGGIVGLEEIVVTAQRRSQNLQSVPIAIAAVPAVQAERLGITDPQSVSQIVPGMTMNRSSMSLLPFIRGVGSNFGTPGFEPSVAIFIDDVYQPTGAAAVFEFNNIASIEVLKGPQGTLFGRNATGGVFQIRTKDPTFEPTADITGTFANYRAYGGQVYASTGLSDTVAINLAAYGNKQDHGWGRNVLTGDPVYTSYSWGYRSKLLWDNHDGTSVLLSASYTKGRADGNGQRAVPGTIGGGGTGYSNPGASFYDSFVNFPAYYVSKVQSYSAKVRHEFDNATFVSITAWGRVQARAPNDTDGSPTAQVNVVSLHDIKTFTQEIQLLAAPGAPVQWILGGFYMHDNSGYGADFSGTAFPTLGRVDSTQITNSISGFAQATAEILPDTNMTVGLRYTSDRRRIHGTDSVGVMDFGPFHDKARFSALTGRFSLDHHFSRNFMGYVAYNRGFKSGTFNISGMSAGSTSLQPVTNPEGMNAWTAGFKSELFDRKVRFNVEAYYNELKNLQVLSLQPFGAGTIITNAGAAHIKGVEADLSIMPARGLTIGLNGAIADGKYTAFPGGPVYFPTGPNRPIPIPAGCAATVPTYPVSNAVAVQRFCDLKGNKTVQTPSFSASASITYEIPTSIGGIALAGIYSHSSKYYWDPDNNPYTAQKPLNLFNGSIKWKSLDNRWSVTLWGKNLSNEKYIQALTSSGSYYNKYSAAPPRTYGITLGASFGKQP